MRDCEMEQDYSNGKYSAFDDRGQLISQIDTDGIIRRNGKPLYRVDGVEIYTVDQPCSLVGFIEDGEGRSATNSSLLFTVSLA